MKAIKLFGILFMGIFSFQFANAQTTKTQAIEVNGNCGMCKKHIEKSALAAGAATASWDKKTKFLNISYDPAVSNPAKIQMAVASAGYDTEDYKASDSAYQKLDECCQYERKDLKEKKE
jgi:hypothetical protein